MSLDRFDSDRKLVEKISKSIRAGQAFHAYLIEGDSLSDQRRVHPGVLQSSSVPRPARTRVRQVCKLPQDRSRQL